MWLLNATTKHLRVFLPEDVPEYAILSHTWDSSADNEVLFSDFKTEGNVRALLPTARLKRSWKKVELTCAQALCDRYDWVWIDTCCIDKSSSSELSEAINSMYAWYRDSGVCYAYLSDVPANVCLKLSKSDFRRSRWFTRGWTLQELLAPSKVVFFVDKEDRPTSSGLGYHERTFGARTRWTQHASRPASPVPEARAIAGWRNIGEKTDLSDLIASVTGIDIDILVDAELLGNASIAQRMSWASNRITSRPEDMAYCLMGLFDVHMPMLYGEGAERAFLRLQEEIMASSDDQSLFAWRDDNATADARYGLLARSPLFFRDSSRIVPYQDWQCRPPYQMTNRGLQVELPLTELPGQKGIYCAILDCPVPPDYEDHCFLAIFLEKIPGSEVQFARVRANKFSQAWHPGQVQQIYVRQQQKAATKPTGLFPRHVFQLRKASLLRADYRAVEILVPPGAEVTETLATQRGATQWIPDRKPQAFRIGKVPWAQVAGAILFEREEDGERLLVRFGSAGRAKVGFDAVRQLPRHRAGAQELDQDHLRRQVRDTFVPRKSGQTVELKHHRVRVNFAEPQVHGGSKYVLIDLKIEAVSLADRTPVSPAPPLWDTITLLSEDSLEKTMSIRSKPPPPPPAAQPKMSTWRRLISKEPTPKPEDLKPPKPFAVRHASSAGTLRELARWDGED